MFFSLIVGVDSFTENISRGNIGAAILDGVGILADAVAVALPIVPGGAGAAIKGIRAVDKTVDAVSSANKINDVSKAVNNSMKHRVKLRVGTKQAIKDAAIKTEDGLFIDPNTLQPIEKGQEVFGHKKGHEWKQYKNNPDNQKKTRQEVIEDQNNPNIYQIEDRKSNASHKYEEK